jgi:hypothetical protein
MSKQTTHRVHIERFNLKKLNEVEGKEWGRRGMCIGYWWESQKEGDH